MWKLKWIDVARRYMLLCVSANKPPHIAFLARLSGFSEMGFSGRSRGIESCVRSKVTSFCDGLRTRQGGPEGRVLSGTRPVLLRLRQGRSYGGMTDLSGEVIGSPAVSAGHIRGAFSKRRTQMSRHNQGSGKNAGNTSSTRSPENAFLNPAMPQTVSLHGNKLQLCQQCR